MRLVTFRSADGRPRAGALLGEALVDLEAAAPLVFDEAETMRWDMLSLLREDGEGSSLDAAAEIMQAVIDQLGDSLEILGDGATVGGGSGNGSGDHGIPGSLSIGGAEMVLPLSTVTLLAPLPQPGSLRNFYAFEEHMLAVQQLRGGYPSPGWYEAPPFQFGNPGAIYGPDDDIPQPRSRSLDYELQLACVIGRRGRDIAEEDAQDYIAGYTIMNDWSARDIEAEERAAGLGIAKGKDFATSLGPALVTPDEIEDLLLPDGRYNLTMVARVNSIQRSQGNLRDIYFTFAQMIARASQDATLYPGDVLGSGAVGGGCLLELTAGRGPWLQQGDLVELAVRGLGTLRNQII